MPMIDTIPKNAIELEQAQKKCLHPVLLNDDHKQQSYGKFVWHYTPQKKYDIDDFILITRHLTAVNQMIYFPQAQFDDDLAEDIGNRDLDKKTRNEYLGYEVMHAMNVHVPKHNMFYDVHKNSSWISLEFIKGGLLSDYLTTQETITPEIRAKTLEKSYQFFAPMIVTGRWDIKDENMILQDDLTLTHFDFDVALEESKFWSDDIEHSKDLALELLKEYIDPFNKMPYSGNSLDIHYMSLTKDSVLKSFYDAREAFNKNKSKIFSQNVDDVLFNINARFDACINHLTAPLVY